LAPEPAKMRGVANWDPQTYRRFASERFAPFEDLIALVRAAPNARAIDLGCGTGELTARLAERLGDGDVLGIDASAQMLERAAEFARPGLRFARSSIEAIDGRFDLIFSNAALHWVDRHAVLFRRLLAMLQPDGQLVVQMPAQRRPAAYSSILDVARSEPHRSALGGFEAPWPVLSIEEYAEILVAAGARDVTAFDKVYVHVLADADALADWQSGTALLPYKERLSPEAYAAFEAELRARLRERWPHRPVTFAFRRSIIAARAAT
jgi:trans-aconitate 2-methyltransferase